MLLRNFKYKKVALGLMPVFTTIVDLLRKYVMHVLWSRNVYERQANQIFLNGKTARFNI